MLAMLGALSGLTGGSPCGSSQDPGERSKWEINLGPLSFGSKGIDLKPQLKIGAQTSGLKAEAGLSDLRDGLKFSAKAEASLDAVAEGKTLKELHASIQLEQPGFREALAAAQQMLDSGAQSLAGIAESLGVPVMLLESSLSGKSLGTMKLKVTAQVGIGMSAQVCFGWEDTKGYHMVGVGGKASAALSVGGNVFAGRHSSGESAKIILGIGNFKFDYIFPLELENLPGREDLPYCEWSQASSTEVPFSSTSGSSGTGLQPPATAGGYGKAADHPATTQSDLLGLGSS